MVAAHLAALRSLLEAAAPRHGSAIKIECKHFFSGAAAYANGRIFMSLTSVGLALKLPPASRAAFAARGAKPLRYFPTGPIKQDYVVVPQAMASDADALAAWIAESLVYCQAVATPRRAPATRRRSPT